MLECCKDCYYRGLKKCFLYEKELDKIENCKEYLIDPYFYEEIEQCKN